MTLPSFDSLQSPALPLSVLQSKKTLISTLSPGLSGSVEFDQPVLTVPQWYLPGGDWANFVPAGCWNLYHPAPFHLGLIVAQCVTVESQLVSLSEDFLYVPILLSASSNGRYVPHSGLSK